jgi:hypothetical protein
MKFSKIFICCSFLMSTNIYANTLNCKHNTLHFATSVDKSTYVKNLLDRKVFTLEELNKQCQTAPHIAVELGSIELLELFYDYLGHLNIENGNGENLLQSTFVHQQPSIALYLISKGLDPNKKSGNGMSANDYQNKYGNNLTKKILDGYNAKKNENLFVENQKENDKLLSGLKEKIKEKENALKLLKESGSGTAEEKNRINSLLAEIADLKKYIFDLEEIIREQALELKKYQDQNLEQVEKLLEIADFSSSKRGVLTTHIPEGQEKNIPISKPIKMQDVDNLEMTDVASDGSVVNDSMKIFELLSKPLAEIKKDK